MGRLIPKTPFRFSFYKTAQIDSTQCFLFTILEVMNQFRVVVTCDDLTVDFEVVLVRVTVVVGTVVVNESKIQSIQ